MLLSPLSQAVRAAVATAAARTEREGGHFVGHLFGLHAAGRMSPQRSELRLAPLVDLPLDGAILPIGVVADLAPGAALRSEVGASALTATASLSIAWRASSDVAPAAVRGRAETLGALGGWGTGRCVLEADDGTVVAVAQATYALVGAPKGGVAAPPWERQVTPPTREAELDGPAWAAEAVDRLRVGIQRSAARSAWDVISGLDDTSWRPAADGEYSVELENGPMQRNRAGHVQGGVLYAAAAVAAGWAAVGQPSERPAVISGSLHYLRPGSASRLVVRCRRLRTGASSITVAVSVLDGVEPIAAGHFLLARRGGGAASQR